VAIPETLGLYRVLERLGKASTCPYLAVHPASNACVMLSELQPADGLDVEYWRTQMPLSVAIHHPHISRIYGLEQDGFVHFFVFEHIGGQNLQEIVERDGPMSVEQACQCIRQAAMGLEYIREIGWTHREVRPGCFLAATTPERPAELTVTMLNPRVPDFLRSSGGMLVDCYDVQVLSAVDFLAPDCVMDAHHADIRGDIYSLGCVFYFLLTGGPPFREGSMAQKLLWHQTRSPTPISEFRADVPAGVMVIVDRMMAKNQQRRFQTPAEVIDALDSLPNQPPPPQTRNDWPAAVVELAKSFEAGQDCNFALYDALVEAGEPTLAEHFRGPWSHPKDCWALRRICHPEPPRQPPPPPTGPLGWLRGLLGLDS
jgi:eukaryotic-like serine/threonine-protein kinase